MNVIVTDDPFLVQSNSSRCNGRCGCDYLEVDEDPETEHGSTKLCGKFGLLKKTDFKSTSNSLRLT